MGLLREFHARAPRVRVVLRQEPAHEILDDLATGTAELAITSARPPAPHAWLPLQEERLVLVVLRDTGSTGVAGWSSPRSATTSS